MFRDVISLNEYQALAHKTAMYNINKTFDILSKDGKSISLPLYPFIKMGAEANEVSDLIAKRIFRGDNNGVIKEIELVKEIGDTLWYVAETASTMERRLSYVAQENLSKLHERLLNNSIRGSGDNR